MPLIPGQGSGLLAGLLLVAFFTVGYGIFKAYMLTSSNNKATLNSILRTENPTRAKGPGRTIPRLNFEAGEELTHEKPEDKHTDKNS